MRTKAEKNQPLLYISPPKTNPIVAHMQWSYIKKKDERQTPVPEIENKKVTRHESQAEESDFEFIEQEIQPSVKKRKKLKEMKISEKIHFLCDLPSTIPKVICEIHTKDQIYYGYIESYYKETVHCRAFTDLEKFKLKVDKIKEIQVLGF